MITAVVALVVATAAVAAVRLAARRDAAPAAVLVSGRVPAAADWIPPALAAYAAQVGGQSSWRDVDEEGVLSGHHAELRRPVAAVAAAEGGGRATTTIGVDLQPHTAPDALAPGARLRLMVSVAEGGRRIGWRRFLLGPGPDEEALALRRRVEQVLGDAARATGARAGLSRRPPVRALLVAATVLVAASAASTAVPSVVDFLNAQADRSSTPTRPQPPANAQRCPAAPGADVHPTRAAVNAKDACGFAEAVRRRYIAADPNARARLQVKSPSTKRTSTVRCSGSDLVTCSRGDLRVYLYSP